MGKNFLLTEQVSGLATHLSVVPGVRQAVPIRAKAGAQYLLTVVGSNDSPRQLLVLRRGDDLALVFLDEAVPNGAPDLVIQDFFVHQDVNLLGLGGAGRLLT